jgi:hypothetical protein
MLPENPKQDGRRLNCHFKDHIFSFGIRYPGSGQADAFKAGKVLPEEIKRPAVSSDDHFMFLPD